MAATGTFARIRRRSMRLWQPAFRSPTLYVLQRTDAELFPENNRLQVGSCVLYDMDQYRHVETGIH